MKTAHGQNNCVIVKNQNIISYGVTNFNGRPHAETIALNKSKKFKLA